MKTLRTSKLNRMSLLTSALLMLIVATSTTVATEVIEQASQSVLAESVTTSHQTTTVYLVRHAEKHLDQGKDPGLTQVGVNRSMRWADVFSNQVLDTIYSTDTKRTRNTALPITESQNKQVVLMEAMPTNLVEIIAKHRGQSILMVGHSNTLPGLVNAMIGEERYADLDESNFSTLFIVTVTGDSAIAQQLKVSL
ncbi:MAG TPA: hypothetical protein DCW52_00450 [Gammaproteobacteria bacterium]|nr:hypothetical protein [Gammaproteobacteria bacterium]